MCIFILPVTAACQEGVDTLNLMILHGDELLAFRSVASHKERLATKLGVPREQYPTFGEDGSPLALVKLFNALVDHVFAILAMTVKFV
jgi:hypothetical protein